MAAKLAVLLEHYEAVSVILGPTDVEEVFQGGHAPSGFHIRLGFRAEDKPAPFDFYLTSHFAVPARTTTQETQETPVANSFSTTLGLGRVAIAIVGGPGVENPARWATGSDSPLMIWPPTVAGLEWPPKHPILRNRQELQQFHEAFWTGIRNADFPRPDALRPVQEPS